MAKNLFDGLSPQAAFASKLLAAAGLDLAALTAAGDVNALKVALESAKTNPDIAAAITEATNKLSTDLATATTALATATNSLSVAESNRTDILAAFNANGIDLGKVEFKKGDTAANTLAVKESMKLTIATAARTELARHGISTPLAEVITTDATKKAEKKPGEGLTGSEKVKALFAADPTVAAQTALAQAKR